MIQSKSAARAKSYFSDALLKADYYIGDQELQGKFGGKLAERLNLSGAVTKDAFFSLCENKLPGTGKPLTPRTKEDRTTGYDINFHCPKSMSIVHALSNDDHLLQAFEASVHETMKDIEADAKTRVRKNGRYEDRPTGELVYASFVHQTARPVKNHLPDPHLHSHVFVFNNTYDPVEKRIKAAQFRDINRDMPYYEGIFHKMLADKLLALGYQIRKTDKSFEIENVPKHVIDLFSKRTDEIGRIAKEKGITDAKALDGLGALSRAKKQKGLSMKELKDGWRRQISDLDKDESGEGDKPIRYAPKKVQEKVTAKQSVDHAILDTFERASVMAERRLLEKSYRHAIGNSDVSIDAIMRHFEQDERIIRIKDKGRTLCTTREVLKEEQRMVTLAREGQFKMVPLYNDAPLLLTLKEQQAAAVSHVLTTANRVSIIRGAAGTGKTTLMRVAVDLIEAKGKKVMVVAPTAQASRGVLKSEGFKNAETVAKLLIDKKLQKDLEGQVLWVDEAGLLGTADMRKLLELVKAKNARLILGGDSRQHSAVVRGDALRILNTVGGIRTAEVNKIYRQQNEHYKAAVQDLSKGKIKDGFDKLDAMGAIKEIDPLQPNDALVNDYLKTIKKGKSALIVSPTHKQGEEVTAKIRDGMRKVGLIGKKEIKAVKLTNLNLTEAQKGDWRSFQEHQIIQFNQHVRGAKRGTFWKIKDIKDKHVQIVNQNGHTISLPLGSAKRYDVYRKSDIGLSKGDTIKINRNGFDEKKKRLNNGMAMEVMSVNKSGKIRLRNKESKATYFLDKEFGHLAHAHVMTSHASQGKTVDEVFISQPSSTFGATDAKQFYVSVSRGKYAVRIYTDDKTALLERASDLGERQSAMELVKAKDSHTRHIENRQRAAYSEPQISHQPKKEPLIDKRIDRDYEPGI